VGFGKRIKGIKRFDWRMLVAGAGLALSLGASNAPPLPSPPGAHAKVHAKARAKARSKTRAKAKVSARTRAKVRARTSARTRAKAAASLQSLTVYPARSKGLRAPFVGVIGDSTGRQLAQPMAASLNPRGVGVVNATTSGCQPTDVVLTYESNEYFERHRHCPHEAQRRQKAMVSHFHPRVVIWGDIMEWSDIQIKGHLVRAGSDRWQQLMFGGFDRTLRRLGDAAVIVILPTWWAGHPTDSPAKFPVERQRALFLAWAARHPGQVTTVDLGAVICPTGPPCRQVMNGVRLRKDSVHYAPAGLRRVIPKIMAASAVLKELGCDVRRRGRDPSVFVLR
jgi:hypothetical protein